MHREPDLIPRKTLFGNPERTDVKISCDGTRISYLAPVKGVLNVWVAKADAIGDAQPVTRETHRAIRLYFWTYSPKHIMYLQDRDGDENWHVYVV
ncbi:MAG: S9 family peptidase, partial [Dehalococcoidia bacterium]|nr:S9 family peptidase [Dehalococcoidia bacterium]